MLNLEQYEGIVANALGGGTLDTQLPVSSGSHGTQAGYVANEAGRQFFSHAWNFRIVGPVDVGFVADVTYALLPVDFGELRKITFKSSLVNYFSLGSIDDVIEHRRLSITTTFLIVAALVYPTGPRRVGLPPPRIEMSPTPATTDADALSVAYWRDWMELENGSDVPNIPQWTERLFIEYVQQHAQAYSNGSKLNIAERLERLETSRLFINARKKDGRTQGEVGPLQGGYIRRPRGAGIDSLDFGAILDPS